MPSETNGTMNHQVYDRATNTWSAAPIPPQTTMNTVVGAYGTKVVAVGTVPAQTPVTVVQVFDTVTRRGRRAPACRPCSSRQSRPRRASTSTSSAGWTSPATARCRDVRRLDMTTMTWSQGPSLPAGRYSSAVMVANDALYVVGGFDNSAAATNTVYRLPLSGRPAGAWTTFAFVGVAVGPRCGVVCPRGDGRFPPRYQRGSRVGRAARLLVEQQP